MQLHHVRRGNGEPLVLVHGIGDSHTAWTRVIGRLAREHEVFAVDAPGFGRSLPLDEEPTIPALAGAVRAFMADQGHERFHVAGNSMGGGIALELARTGAAASACALCPTGFAAGWELWWTRATLVLTKYAVALPRPPGLTRSALARRLLAGQMVADGARYAPDELDATMAALDPYGAFLRTLGPISAYDVPAGTRFKCPVTIAWGEHDHLLLYGPQHRRAQERLPDVRHVTLTGCGHVPMWDDPQQVAGVMLAATRSPAPRASAAA
jgi:pimeloyl-ACP methyl ester carboxylesterase